MCWSPNVLWRHGYICILGPVQTCGHLSANGRLTASSWGDQLRKHLSLHNSKNKKKSITHISWYPFGLALTCSCYGMLQGHIMSWFIRGHERYGTDVDHQVSSQGKVYSTWLSPVWGHAWREMYNKHGLLRTQEHTGIRSHSKRLLCASVNKCILNT